MGGWAGLGHACRSAEAFGCRYPDKLRWEIGATRVAPIGLGHPAGSARRAASWHPYRRMQQQMPAIYVLLASSCIASTTTQVPL